MSKKIIIKGKKSFNAFNNIKNPKRNSVEKWKHVKELSNENINNQIKMLNMLYLNQEYQGKQFVKSEVERKINSYKNQDKRKHIFDESIFITYNEVLEKLVISKLKCYYCKRNCLLMFSNYREKTQWTLDRIDNDVGHSKDNTVICCLECNLKKGTMNDEKFKFTKQLKIIKKYE
jgi:hypothetical protein